MKQAGRLSMASHAIEEKLATWELAKTEGWGGRGWGGRGGGVGSSFLFQPKLQNKTDDPHSSLQATKLRVLIVRLKPDGTQSEWVCGGRQINEPTDMKVYSPRYL